MNTGRTKLLVAALMILALAGALAMLTQKPVAPEFWGLTLQHFL